MMRDAFKAGMLVQVKRRWWWYRPTQQTACAGHRGRQHLIWSRRPSRMEEMPQNVALLVLRCEGPDVEFYYHGAVFWVIAGDVAHLEKDFTILGHFDRIERVDVAEVTVERFNLDEVYS